MKNRQSEFKRHTIYIVQQLYGRVNVFFLFCFGFEFLIKSRIKRMPTNCCSPCSQLFLISLLLFLFSSFSLFQFPIFQIIDRFFSPFIQKYLNEIYIKWSFVRQFFGLRFVCNVECYCVCACCIASASP